MSDQRIWIVKEIEHHEQSDLVQLPELSVWYQELFVLEPSQSPKMRKSLNRGLFLGCVDFCEWSFDSLSELIREESAEGYNHIYDFRVHVREIEKRPQFLQGQFLIIITDLFAFLLHYDVLETFVDRVLLFPHENFYHSLNWSQWNYRIRQFNALFDCTKPVW